MWGEVPVRTFAGPFWSKRTFRPRPLMTQSGIGSERHKKENPGLCRGIECLVCQEKIRSGPRPICPRGDPLADHLWENEQEDQPDQEIT